MCTWRRVGDASCWVAAATLRRAGDAPSQGDLEYDMCERATRCGRASIRDKLADFWSPCLRVSQHSARPRPHLFPCLCLPLRAMADVAAETLLAPEAAQEPLAEPAATGSADGTPAACTKCGLPLQPGEKSLRKSRNTIRCARCHAAMSQLLRHLGGMPAGWEDMTEARRMIFFRDVKAASASGLAYEKIRSILVDTLTQTSKKVEKTSVGGTFQPLSWWAQSGYDVEAVRLHGEKEEHQACLCLT